MALGLFIGSSFPILFSSEDFCNKYLRFTPDTGGIISIKSKHHLLYHFALNNLVYYIIFMILILFYISGFLVCYGFTCLVLTTLIGIFKKEKDERSNNDHVKINFLQNYKLLWDILKLPSMRSFVLIILTSTVNICFTKSFQFI